MELVLALDLGGTSLRVALVSRTAEVVALAAHPQQIGAEADPAGWWLALGGLLDTVLSAGPATQGDIAAIGLCGITRSQVFADAAGTPLRPAICFSDGRATAEAEALADATAGTWGAMSAYHPLARLAWLRTHEPDVLAATRHMLQPKDWLAMRLTGRPACDRISNAWAMERHGARPALTEVRSLALFRRADLDPALLPDILNPWDRVGRVHHLPPGAPAWLAGLPVFTGGMDTWCASVGAGAGLPGDAYLVSGTTDAGGVLTEHPVDSPGLVTLPWGEALFHVGGPSSAGADCLEWLASLLGMPDAAAIGALAETATPDAAPLVFLPALTGERAPGWHAAARGGFLGLDRRHGPPELARAVLEGVAFADRDLLAGDRFARLLLTGGGARSDFWCQLRADILGCPVLRAPAREAGIVGAALVAWTGLGAYPSLLAAQAVLEAGQETWLPDPAHAERAEAGYRRYKGFQAAAPALLAGAASA